MLQGKVRAPIGWLTTRTKGSVLHDLHPNDNIEMPSGMYVKCLYLILSN